VLNDGKSIRRMLFAQGMPRQITSRLPIKLKSTGDADADRLYFGGSRSPALDHDDFKKNRLPNHPHAWGASAASLEGSVATYSLYPDGCFEAAWRPPHGWRWWVGL